MHKDVFSIRSSALPDETRLVAFRGTEALSRPYEFELFLVLTDSDADEFDMADAIGAKASLVAHREDGEAFVFHGILCTVELVHQMGSRALFRAVLVPHLWQLKLTHHSKMFTAVTVPDVIKATLEDGGLTSDDYELRLNGNYPVEEHICQYKESHFDFISRWMEREGLYYYFEQNEDGEKLVITDDKSFHDHIDAAVRYYPLAGSDVTAGERLDSFKCRHRHLPATVKLKDYDYLKPTLDVTGSAKVAKNGLGEISLHGARFFTPDQGKQLAKVRAEELLAGEVTYLATGNTLRLHAGYVFELEDHPRASFNAKYLVTEVVHHGNQAQSSNELRKMIDLAHDEVYRMDVVAIPAGVQFRAPSTTPWPRIYGTENGIVDGPADSEYAQIDDHGRYAVKFKFDESPLKDGRASTFVRMLQPHGGGIEGFHFPLRKGTEVLFTFLGGDPDRPVIAGVVPNLHTPSPVTSANHTKNVLQTGGRNRFELEDKAGLQRITLSTPHQNSYLRMGAPNDDHEVILHTDARTLLDVGTTWDVLVGEDFNEHVTGDTNEEYMGTKTEWVQEKYQVDYQAEVESMVVGESKLTYHGEQQVKWDSGRKEETTGALEETIHGAIERKHLSTVEETITGKVGRKISNELEEEVGGKVDQKYKAGYELTVTGNAEQKATSEWKIEAPTAEVKAASLFKFEAGTSIGFSISASSETCVGIKNENFIGIKIESSLALKLECAMGINVKLNEALELSFKVAKIEAAQTRIENVIGPHILDGALWLNTHGIEIHL